MSSSWYLLPSGQLAILTRTQDLLVDLMPVVEELAGACERLQSALAECGHTRDEAQRLIVRSRRQRLGLQLVTRETSPGGHQA
jgi:hypothetical protein